MTQFYLRAKVFLPQLVSSFFSLLKVIFLTRKTGRFPEKLSTDCVVLGNGPSLKHSLETQLDFLSKSELFCVNNFAVSAYYQQLKPRNYVLLDPFFFKYELADFPNPAVAASLKAIHQNTTWELHLFVPRSARHSATVRFLSQNPNIKLVYFNYVVAKGIDPILFWLFKNQWAMPQCQNVLAATTFLAINQRFERVYLMGADHSWHEEIHLSNNGQQVLMRHLHFYNNAQTAAVTQHGTNPQMHTSLATQFSNFSKIFQTYELLERYANHLKIKVLNASSKSYIDAFERVEL